MAKEKLKEMTPDAVYSNNDKNDVREADVAHVEQNNQATITICEYPDQQQRPYKNTSSNQHLPIYGESASETENM